MPLWSIPALAFPSHTTQTLNGRGLINLKISDFALVTHVIKFLDLYLPFHFAKMKPYSCGPLQGVPFGQDFWLCALAFGNNRRHSLRTQPKKSTKRKNYHMRECTHVPGCSCIVQNITFNSYTVSTKPATPLTI